MRISNSSLIAKTKQSNYKKGLCLTEKLVHKIRYYSYTIPLCFIKQVNNIVKISERQMMIKMDIFTIFTNQYEQKVFKYQRKTSNCCR